MKKLLISVAFVAMSFTTAFAQDTFDWNGWYLGGIAGYGNGGDVTVTGLTLTPFDDDDGVGHSVNTDYDGMLIAAQLGWNREMNNWVAGVEWEFGYLDVSGQQLIFPDAPIELDDTGIEVDFGFYTDLAARLGYAQGRWMVYGKGGVSFADISLTAGDVDDDAFDFAETFYQDGIETGYVIGAGMAVALRQNVSLRGEYLYRNFGDFSGEAGDGSEYGSTSIDLHTFTAGVNFHF